MRRKDHRNIVYYQFEMDVIHGVFTRLGGVSRGAWEALNLGGTVGDDVDAVQRNHTLMLETLQLNATRSCTVWLVHGADTVMVQGPVEGRRWVALADGMVTDQPDTPLVMRYADCTPILFHDPVQAVIGIAHAGWKGSVSGAASSVAKTMIQAYGCRPEDIRAGIGPSIGPDRYQVGEEVVQAVGGYFGTTEGDAPEGPLIRRDPQDGSAYFNLWAANRLDLERAGLQHIEVSGICTASNTDEFYSHRAENGKTGRFGAVISL